MNCLLANVGVWSTPAARVLLVLHLLVCAFAIGAVTHHWWVLRKGDVPVPRLGKFALWMAIGYALAWVTGVVIYPTYNVMIRKPPIGVLEKLTPAAVGLFEIKEHLGTIALVMLPWLVLSAWRYDVLSRLERISYVVGTWVFTVFVYYVFISGGIVTMTRSFGGVP